jgi:hypothetical protein
MAELKESCVKPARGPIIKQSSPSLVTPVNIEEEKTMVARVGQEAPDFEANAFVVDKGFVPIKLSDYKGKWIVLCFYPGDFTFV